MVAAMHIYAMKRMFIQCMIIQQNEYLCNEYLFNKSYENTMYDHARSWIDIQYIFMQSNV